MSKKMRRLISKKATSSAAIVSVMVIGMLVFSLAVAVSSGALTFAFLSYEQVSFNNFVFGPNNAYCTVTVENTGTADLTILTIRINGIAPRNITPSLLTPYELKHGSSAIFTLTPTESFVHNNSYELTVITTRGNSFIQNVIAAP